MIKKLAIGIALFSLLLFSYFTLGSIDRDEFDDLGLYDVFVQVDEVSNGFLLLSFTQDESFDLYDNKEDQAYVRSLLNNSVNNWDQERVDRILNENDRYLSLTIEALEKPGFLIHRSNAIYELPRYAPLVELGRLFTLKAVDDYRKREFKSALNNIGYATAFSEKVQSESNHILISYMVGQAIQEVTMEWISKFIDLESSLAKEYPDYSTKNLRMIQNLLEGMQPYHQDGFKETFSGELKFQDEYFHSMLNEGFSLRWQNFVQSIFGGEYEELDPEGSEENEPSNFETKEFLSAAIYLVFPRFYIHRNKILNVSALNFKKLADLSDLYCNAIDSALTTDAGDLEADLWSYEPGWKDMLTPNSSAKELDNQGRIFHEYFIKRCFSHTRISALKSKVALGLHRVDHGQMPEALTALVSPYLTVLPIDFFNGKTLRYSKERGYLYSVGSNYEDNGGSLESLYNQGCYEYDECSINPTFNLYKEG